MSAEATILSRTSRPSLPVFLVLERDPLIAEDIAGSLEVMGPCQTIRVSDAQDVARLLDTDICVSAAFLELRYSQVLELGLDRRLADHGAAIILTTGEDDEHGAQSRGWGMLVRPFTDHMIRDAFSGLGR